MARGAKPTPVKPRWRLRVLSLVCLIVFASADEPVVLSPDGRWRLETASSSIHNYTYKLTDPQGLIWNLTPSVPESVNHLAHLLDDGSVLMVADRGKEWMALWCWSPVTHQWTVLTQGPWDVEAYGFAVSPSEQRLAFMKNEDGESKLYLRDDWRSDAARERVVSLPPGHGYGLRFLDDDHVSLSLDGWRNGTAHIKVAWDKTAVPRLVYQPSDVRRVVIRDTPGARLSGWYYASEGNAKGVIVFLHGGPSAQHRPTQDSFLERLLAQDWNILAINARGSRGYGRTFMDLDNGKGRRRAVEDTLLAADYARQQLQAERVVVLGTSYGAYLGLLSLLDRPQAFDRAVMHAGPYEVASRVADERFLREYGSVAEQTPLEELVKSASDRLPPLLLLYGEQDKVVSPEDTKHLAKLLSRPSVQTYGAPKAGHSTSDLLPIVPLIDRFMTGGHE